jgi:hypothetical protein
MRPALRFPEDVRKLLARTYRNQHRAWLAGAGVWPLVISLGCPTEAEAQMRRESVRDWVLAWRGSQGPGKTVWSERRWPALGPQSLPDKLVLEDAQSIAAWIGEEDRWGRARQRYQRTASQWAALATRLPRYFDALADYSDQDLLRLEALLSWIEINPGSNLYPRQIPLAGMDTKWLEARTPLVTDLVAALQGDAEGNGFHQRCGLKESPHIVRFRILDQSLRERVGGLGDIAAPVGEIAGLRLPISRVYIVENVQTGLCFGDRPGSIVFMGLGYGVSALGRLPWLVDAECIYWGDVDTHGFVILNRLRACLPNTASALMDESTLLRNRSLWGEEQKQASAPVLPLLTAEEQTVYQGLKQQRWGPNVRLEQERIAWNEAWQAICG